MNTIKERTTILVGNGLGMAVNPKHFTLSEAMFNSYKTLPTNAQDRLTDLLPPEACLIPNNENDLPLIQEIIFALELLTLYEKEKTLWLHEEAKDFLSSYREYVINIANHFFNYSNDLSENFKVFIKNLCSFINNNNTHVATLNYDKLLYEPLIHNHILGDIYTTKLSDGLWDKGFCRENLERKYDNKFGYYLHLHGSPLFYSKDGKINKDKIAEYCTDNSKLRNHIVLTHSKFKPSIITKSELLDIYWDYFNQALNESNRLILFGYSGGDNHVNLAIRNWIKLRNDSFAEIIKSIRIVEYRDQINDIDRLTYWRNIISSALEENNIKRYTSILDYNFDT